MSSLDQGKMQCRPVRMGNAFILVLAMLIAGCSSDRLFSDSTPTGSSAKTSPSFGERLSNFFGDKSAQSQVQVSGPAAELPPDFDCPTVEIRTGTSTYTVSAPGTDASAMSLRYQATIGETARECKLTAGTLTIRVGLEGRLILGPAGSAGQVDVPLRVAVVREGTDPKMIVTKLRWFSVVVPAGETNVLFTQIEDDLSFPMPRGKEIDAYVVYIGFDRAAVKEPEKKKPPAKKPPRRAG
jgi:hypothetical protein